LAAVRGEYDTERSHLAEMKTSLVACREKLEALKKERATISEMMEELEMKKISSRDNIAAAEEKIASSHSEMEKDR